MELIINLQKLGEEGLSPNEYCYLMCWHKKIEHFTFPEADAFKLQTLGYGKITPDGFIIRQKFIDFIKDDVSPIDVPNWIQEWREIWPEGVKTMGRPVRGDKAGCITKMTTFVRQNPKVTKEQIFDATKIYVFEKAQKGYSHMTCADYFIKKDGISLLAALVENLQGRESYLNRMQEEGKGIFHKEV